MYFIPLSLSFLFSTLILIVLLIAGVVAVVELFIDIFPTSATSVSLRVAVGLYRSVTLALIVYALIVTLQALIGGGTNAH